jgi:hypothetical protein
MGAKPSFVATVRETTVPERNDEIRLFDGEDVDDGDEAPQEKDFGEAELEAILATREAAGTSVADGEGS